MLGTILIIVYIIACLFLILVVLLQAGKGGGMGAIGGGGSSTVFGGRGAATFLTRLTGIMAALFMLLSVGISLNMGANRSDVTPEDALEEEIKKEDLSNLIPEDNAKPVEKAKTAEEKPAEEAAPKAEEEPAEEAAPKAEEKPADAPEPVPAASGDAPEATP